MERLTGHYGHYCEYCLGRWQTATMFDYCILFVVIITAGWLTSRLQSQSLR